MKRDRQVPLARRQTALMVACVAACSSPAGSPGGAPPPAADAGTSPVDGGPAVSQDGAAGARDGQSSDAQAAFDSSVPDATIPPVMPGVWRNITGAGIDPTVNPCTDIQVFAGDRKTLIAMYGGSGLWKSSDAGVTWAAIASNPPLVSLGRVRIDPNDASHLYATGSVTAGSLGFWVSTDGGATFAAPAKFTSGAAAGQWITDVYNIAVDPTDFNHVLLGFHNAWPGTSYAGIVESTDGGVTFVPHPFTAAMFPGGNGYGGGLAFLYDPATGLGDANRWLVGGGYATGLFTTTDAGQTWTPVTVTSGGAFQDDHGGFDAHYSAQGFLYAGGWNGVYRSTDNGSTWAQVSQGSMASPTYSVIGDGMQLYTSPAFVGIPPNQPVFVATQGGAAEGTVWTTFGTTILPNGPWRMVFDDSNRIIYSANWDGGAWALTAGD
jgi:hypothetical protein